MIGVCFVIVVCDFGFKWVVGFVIGLFLGMDLFKFGVIDDVMVVVVVSFLKCFLVGKLGGDDLVFDYFDM